MPETLDLKIKGLYSNPNQLGMETPLGALAKADNVVIDRDSIADSRRGQTQYAELLAVPLKEFEYQDTLLVNYSTNMAYDSDNDGTMVDYSGSFASPDPLVRIHSLEANQNFYITTLAGIKKLDSVTSQFTSAGGIKALYGTAALSNPGFMSNNVQVDYRMVWGKIDANGNEIIGAPSQRLVVVNSTGSTANITTTWQIPAGIDTTYFYRIYRSGESAGVSFPPDDEVQQVKEGVPTSAEISAGSFSFYDQVPNTLRGAFLYTDPSQEGILKSNEPPPFALDMCLFRNCVFYFNTKSKQRFEFSLVSVGDNSTGGAFGYQTNNGTTHTNTTIDALTKKASVIIQDLTYTADTAGVAGNNITITYTTGGTAGAEVVTVSGSNISVKIQSGVSTATQVKTAVDASGPAAALVDITISGTAGTAQVAQAVTFLTDGFDTTYLRVGQRVVGTGVQTGTKIVSIDSISAITVTPATTASATVSLEFQDIFRIDSHEYYAASTADYPNNQFQAVLSGTPGSNIQNTALNLITAINKDTTNTTVYAYYESGSSDLPGQILLEERGIGGNAFAVTSTNGGAFSPILSNTGTNDISDNDAHQNRVMISKVQQPEAVPLLQFLDVGSENFPIVRGLALRDSIFVFKPGEGIFRISGTDITNFTVSLFDSSAQIKAPESAVILNNQVACFSDQGIIFVSETGVQIISRPIESDLLEISSDLFPLFDTETFAVSYETDRKYILFTLTNVNDVHPTQAFVYNSITNTFTRWVMNRTCGLVLKRDNKLYTGNPDNMTIYKERKSFDRNDYADEQYDIFISSISGSYATIALSTELDSSNFTSSSGWTLVTTQATIVFNGLLTITKLANGLTNGGVVRTNTVNLGVGSSVAFDLKYSFTGGATGINLFAYLTDELNLSQSFDTKAGMTILTFAGADHLSLQSTFGDIGDVITLPDTQYNFLFYINDDGTLSIYYKLSTDTDYILVARDETEANGGSVNWIGRPVRTFFSIDAVYSGTPSIIVDNYVVNSASASLPEDLEGSVIRQGVIESEIENDLGNGSVVLLDEPQFSIGPATLYKSIPVDVEWLPNTAANPGELKQYSECTIFLRDSQFRSLTLGVQNNFDSSFDNVELTSNVGLGWGQFAWGEEPWGLRGEATQAIRTLVPLERQRSSWVNFRVKNNEAFSKLGLSGISAQFNPMSSRFK